uniref:DOMON domain-containing protein n=1 Tax=Zea mays TaxID=4577 RepID=C0PKH5_MAIZE|nr:unknown [Zea mays]
MPRHLALLLPLLLLASPAATRLASAACAGEKFPAGRAYASCEDLPKLGASLHWTYDASKSSLSVAFVAAPAAAGGWVAWGLNPTGEGMAGAQALVALAGAGAAAPAVRTYNITGYVPLGKASTPLDFPATDLAADAAGGKIRVYGKLQLRKGMKAVNQVWQVGASSTGGARATCARAGGVFGGGMVTREWWSHHPGEGGGGGLGTKYRAVFFLLGFVFKLCFWP